MDFITIMAQDITDIVTKNMIGMMDTTIINTIIDITDMRSTMADIIDMVIIRTDIIGHTSIFILVDMDIDVMDAKV